MSLIRAEKIAYKYHYDDAFIFTDLSFSVETGSVCTLLIDKFGGKTTLAKVLVGLLKLTKGEIFLNDRPLDSVPPEKRNFAYITYPTLYQKGTVLKNAAYGLTVRGKEKKDAFKLAEVKLREYGLNVKPKQKVKMLSDADKMRLAFARAFCRDVSLIILDGCFGADTETDDFLKRNIEQKTADGCAILVLSDDKKYAFGKTYDFLLFDATPNNDDFKTRG